MELHRIVRQALRAPASRDLAARDRADDAVDVADRQARLYALAALDRRAAKIEQRRHVERLLEAVILIDLPVAPHLRPEVRLIQNIAEVEALRLPVIDRLLRLEPVDPPDHLIERPESEPRDVLGPAREALAQPRVLRRDPDRAGVQVTDAHHDAAERDERRRREAELLGAEESRDRHVAPRLQLPVYLHRDAE